MKNNYLSKKTPQVKPYIQYEKDFDNSGQFEELEDMKAGIILMTDIWPGKYDGENWIYQPNSDDESYAINIYYLNKNQIEIIFDASYGNDYTLKKSFDFIKSAAEKFYLVNDYFSDKDFSKNIRNAKLKKPDEDTPFDELEKLITALSKYFAWRLREEVDIRDGNSWNKTMTLTEAKELFNYLKIGVDFPH